MRFSTLLSAASFAFALASPALAQQPNDMREEIRRIVREEVRSALREAMQEMHGVAPKAGGEAAKAKKEPAKKEPARTDQPVVRRLLQPRIEHSELRELETEMKELEKTLERLQGEIGRKVGGQLRELQPLLRGKVLEGMKVDAGEMKVELDDVTHEIKLSPTTRIFQIGGDGEAIELEAEGQTKIHVITPKDGTRVIQVPSIKFHDSGEIGEKQTEKKDAKEKTEAKPKTKKTVKAAEVPSVGSLTMPALGEAKVVTASGDGCNCVIVIRCENGKCTVETNCDGAQQVPVELKTLLPKLLNKAKSSEGEDCTLQIKVDTGCCDETPKAKSDCCTGGACTDCAPAKSGCCDEAKTEVKKVETKVTDKKKLIS